MQNSKRKRPFASESNSDLNKSQKYFLSEEKIKGKSGKITYILVISQKQSQFLWEEGNKGYINSPFLWQVLQMNAGLLALCISFDFIWLMEILQQLEVFPEGHSGCFQVRLSPHT